MRRVFVVYETCAGEVELRCAFTTRQAAQAYIKNYERFRLALWIWDDADDDGIPLYDEAPDE